MLFAYFPAFTSTMGEGDRGMYFVMKILIISKELAMEILLKNAII